MARRVPRAAAAVVSIAFAAACGANSANGAGQPPASPGPTAAAPSSSAVASSAAGSSPAPSSSATVPSATGGGPTTPGTAADGVGSGGGHRDPRCHAADVSAKIVAGSPGAGQRYASIVLTVTADHACSIYGYGGMALVTASGAPVPTSMQRSPAIAPVLITLSPGGRVFSALHWTAIPGEGEGGTSYEPTARHALVTPPDEKATLKVDWTNGPVCEHGQIEQGAYRIGTGS